MATRLSRTPFVGGNWKMNLTRAGAAELARATADAATGRGVECVVFPPFVYLDDAIVAQSADMSVGAQDCSAEAKGAFTGQVSADMLRDIGCTHVLIGHSERRHGLCETDALLARKVARVLEAGLVPVLCVGKPSPSARPATPMPSSKPSSAARLRDIPRTRSPPSSSPTSQSGPSAPAARRHPMTPPKPTEPCERHWHPCIVVDSPSRPV
jgi:hypothetical protein